MKKDLVRTLRKMKKRSATKHPKTWARVEVVDGEVTVEVYAKPIEAVLIVEDYKDRTLSAVRLTEDHAMKLAQILGTVWTDR